MIFESEYELIILDLGQSFCLDYWVLKDHWIED